MVSKSTLPSFLEPCVAWRNHEFPQPAPGSPHQSPTSSEAIPELRFLERPPSSTFEPGRVLKITGELVRGFRGLHFAGPCVTVFGSARIPEESP